MKEHIYARKDFKAVAIKALKITGVILVVLLITGYIGFYVIFSGGVSGLVSELKPAPKPMSQKVISFRNNTIDNINATFVDLEKQVGYIQPYASATHDRCYEGDHSWKRNDSYAYRCTYRITKFYGVTGDFRQQMTELEQQLLASGWEYQIPRHPSSISKILRDYYGPASTREVNQLPKPEKLSKTDMYSKYPKFLEIGYTDEKNKNFTQEKGIQKVTYGDFDEIYSKEDFLDVPEEIKKITNEMDYVLILAIEQDYFRN